MNSSSNVKIIDGLWKDRIDRALKNVSRSIDLRQRRDATPLIKSICQQVEEEHRSRPLKFLPAFTTIEEKARSLYNTNSFDELNNEKLVCSMSILPQVDPLPSMFTYVSLQSNFLCDTMTDLSDLILEQDDEDVKNLLNSVQSEPIFKQPTSRLSPNSSSKRTRRSSKSATFNDRNNEFILDEEHLVELLKRLKQQHGNDLTSDDENNLFETMIAIFPSTVDLIRERFGTIFETKRIQAKEFTPNIDNPALASDTTVENTLHSYFMLFCRRCHRYDCFLHKDKQATPDLKRPRKNFEMNYRPCSKRCYLIKSHLFSQSQKRQKVELKRSQSELVESSLNSIKNDCFPQRMKSPVFKKEVRPPSPIFNRKFSNNGFIFKPIIKKKPVDDFSSWSTSDKSLFRVFSTIYSDNICMIADLLDKTCQQVYQFYLKEIESSTNTNGYAHRQISSISSISDLTSSTSSDGSEMKINGEQSSSEETHLSNHHRSSSRRSHFSSFRRQRSHQHLLINHLNTLNAEKKRHTYYPCEHDRSTPCNDQCYCVRSNNFCEKYCCCASTKCDNRFPGCRCRSSCTTKQCPCYAAGRECDPDLCTQCGADDFHSNNGHQDFQTKTICSCHNVAIQRSLHKPLLLAESDVAGWGIFTQVNIQRNEFIAEYCGEILTQDEGEIRGRMYDSIGTSFLFDLNEEYMVDATRRGNKIRFANHSINPNCYAKVIMVNGDHRIGIYSKRFIAAGDELFFDYRYGANHHLRFVGVEKANVQDPTDP